MRAPTANPITQTAHGAYSAVDYDNLPDTNLYAPEGGQITFARYDGDCGNKIWLQTSSGRHTFCHLESFKVSLNQNVSKGQILGIIGKTGKVTASGGGDGSHLHWAFKNNSGQWIYPPSLINEPFKEDEMYDGKTAAEWYAIANDWHVRADDRQKVIERLENEVQDLKKRVADLEANPAQDKLNQIKAIVGA